MKKTNPNLMYQPRDVVVIREDMADTGYSRGQAVTVIEAVEDPRRLAPPYYLVKDSKGVTGYIFEEDIETYSSRSVPEDNPVPTLKNKLLR